MLLSGFNALGPISIPTPPTMALTEFFHDDRVASLACIVIFDILVVRVSVFLYAYNVNVIFCS